MSAQVASRLGQIALLDVALALDGCSCAPQLQAVRLLPSGAEFEILHLAVCPSTVFALRLAVVQVLP